MRPVARGVFASIALLAVYFGVLTLVSGWNFTVSQFAEFWPYIVALAVGFGAQIGLYFYLRQLSTEHHYAHCAVAASGTTSTVAMLACCTHYLTNVLPVLGATGLLTVVAQYQVEFFWLGLAFNIAGLLYVLRQVLAAKEAYKESHA
jgi:P-type Cu+ transporter